MSKAKVLVVEDQPFLREGITALLSGGGYKVAEAGSAEEALVLAEAFRPDAVTINYNLPGLSGVELAERLRRLPDLESVPFLLVTSEELPGNCAGMPLPHVTGYLNKKDLIEQLIPCIESHLRGR